MAVHGKRQSQECNYIGSPRHKGNDLYNFIYNLMYRHSPRSFQQNQSIVLQGRCYNHVSIFFFLTAFAKALLRVSSLDTTKPPAGAEALSPPGRTMVQSMPEPRRYFSASNFLRKTTTERHKIDMGCDRATKRHHWVVLKKENKK